MNNLTSILGVASKTIAAIISECGDLTRFPTVTKFIGFLGLFPTENSSGLLFIFKYNTLYDPNRVFTKL